MYANIRRDPTLNTKGATMRDYPSLRKWTQGSYSRIVRKIDCSSWWRDNWIFIIGGVLVIIIIISVSMYFIFNCENHETSQTSAETREIRFNLNKSDEMFKSSSITTSTSTTSTSATVMVKLSGV